MLQRWLNGGAHGAVVDEVQRWPPFIAVYYIEATRACARWERVR
jgi:hypothetical protein